MLSNTELRKILTYLYGTLLLYVLPYFSILCLREYDILENIMSKEFP